jgi:hypothetical protein
MKTIEIEVPDDIAAEFSKNHVKYQTAVQKFLSREIRYGTIEKKLELVKTITRIKAPVKNWVDLEKEILYGAIGKESGKNLL